MIQSTCSTLKKIFLSRFIREYYAFTRWRYFTTTTRILFVQRWLGLVFKQMQRQCLNPPPQPTQFASILSPPFHQRSDTLLPSFARLCDTRISSIYLFEFCNPSEVKSPYLYKKAKRPTGSGRKMTSSCKWPFSSYLVASSLLNPSLYFSRGGRRIL